MNEYQTMVADLSKPGGDIITSLTPIKAHTLHMAVGLAGEAGELLEHFCAGIEEVNGSSIIEELGDAEFYFEGLCQSMGITIGQSGATSDDPLSVPRYVVATTQMLDIIKKMVIHNKDTPLMTFVNALTEVRVYLDRVYSYYGFTQTNAQLHNLDKLLKGKGARYKDGSYSDEASAARADKVKS